MTRKSNTNPAPLAYRIGDAQSVSGLGRTKIYELIAEGKLKSICVGRRRLILADSLRSFLENTDEQDKS